MTNNYLALNEIAKDGSIIVISNIDGVFIANILDVKENIRARSESKDLNEALRLLDIEALYIIKRLYRNESLAFLRKMLSAINTAQDKDYSVKYFSPLDTLEIVDNHIDRVIVRIFLKDIDALAFTKFEDSADETLNKMITAFLTITSYSNLTEEIRANDIVFGVIE